VVGLAVEVAAGGEVFVAVEVLVVVASFPSSILCWKSFILAEVSWPPSSPVLGTSPAFVRYLSTSAVACCELIIVKNHLVD
jgi:hypothetical protein